MWSNYLRGTLNFLKQQYHNLGGINLVISGNVPRSAGLSSSASFEIAILRVMVDLFLLELDGVKAAVLAQRAENEFVGCNCGIMDQLISALGQEGQAMLLDCRSLAYKYAPIPSGMQILVVNSNVKRGLVDSEYNLRRQQCEQVAEIANIPALRDMDLSALQTVRHRLTEIQYKRALHVITENMRTADALQALVANDIGLLSQLMRESHDSLRDNFQVSTEELDGLVEIIDQVIGQHGGVRMTGGGFGGCVVALVPRSLVSAVIDAVTSQYPKRFRLTPDIYQCQASMGAFSK
jgi:galactokinase